jgi:hypothetical protein
MTLQCREPRRLRAILCFGFHKTATPEEIEQFTEGLLQSEFITDSAELSGVFDFMSEAIFPSIMVYNDTIQELEQHPVVRVCESSLVCRQFSHDGVDDDIWVKDGDGSQIRVAIPDIDKVVAEGDYMRIFSDGEEWLHHCTMTSLEERLGQAFVRLNRSTLCRADFIVRIRHRSGKWVAYLRDDSTYRISRPHVKEVIDLTSPPQDVVSSKPLLIQPQQK